MLGVPLLYVDYFFLTSVYFLDKIIRLCLEQNFYSYRYVSHVKTEMLSMYYKHGPTFNYRIRKILIVLVKI